MRGGRGGGGGGGRRGVGRGRGRGSGGPWRNTSQGLSEEELKTLSEGKPDDVQASVTENEAKFLSTYKVKHYCSHPISLKRLISLLSLLTQCQDQSSAWKTLAQILSPDGEYALFTTEVDKLLRGMSLETRGYIKKENLSCIEQLIDIGCLAIRTIPSTVVVSYPVALIGFTIAELRKAGDRVNWLSSKFEDMNSVFQAAKLKIVRERREKMRPKESESVPPEPFTQLSILPTPREIHLDSGSVFLRKNKIVGSYNSCDHYFDVQFRLLREDFIRPLREGIATFRATKSSSSKYSDIRVYEGAKILNPVCLFTGIGFQLRFDASKFSRVNWEHSRRLIFGSLLCLSNDNFENCLHFATVVKRDPKELKEGLLTIKFENDVNGFLIDPSESYVMVESTAYYEAYRHVLKSIKDISESPDLIPLEKCIVKCDFAESRIPVFLNIPSTPPRFNMAEILTPNPKKLPSRKVFDVTKPDVWPPANHTDLDASQLHALKMALSSEVTVIQGPPGTGKTFIGIKIVESYLRNRVIWDPQKAAPILVICYTNHALDQFLEGIHKLDVDGKCPNIVRVGGRCKSADLESCILSNKVQECRSNRSIPFNLFRNFMDARSELFSSKELISRKAENCDAESKHKIIDLKILSQVLSPLHYSQLLCVPDSAIGREMMVWLELWYPEGESSSREILPQNSVSCADASFSNDEECIEVDEEARILEEERMIEGEVLEVEVSQKPEKKKDEPELIKVTKDKYDWSTVQLSSAERKKRISNGFNNTAMSREEASRISDIQKLPIEQKWRLYLYWINEYTKICKEEINATAQHYNAVCEAYGHSQRAIDCFVAKGADIIGMTTTGAAKYRHLLKEIHPKIAIFEEAAEVLEVHVVTSLTASVQQLIMIGDHKQLKPKPTCYDLEKHYNLDVSLFERLINNSHRHVTLEKQHRMRPEISKLIHPSIYPKLEDAEEVCIYPHVTGIGKDVFFIQHYNHEESNDLYDSKSHVNKFEAEYIVELCHYLLKQGYSTGDITVLTMYRGQLLELKQRMKREDFEGLRVAAVDDFQGEENKIILLSLVRSNPEGVIGFLSIENRVCVSLSRAKQGLYVIGNFDKLQERADTKWPEIIHYVKQIGCFGCGLPLYCQLHSDSTLEASKPADFRQRPEGGCTKVCGTKLSCGHFCERICHPKDVDHKFTVCAKNCSKTLPCGHKCKGKCFQCTKRQKCIPCSERMQKSFPLCGHIVTLTCSEDPVTAQCTVACQKFLPCGHKCQSICSAPCTMKCNEMIERKLPCGHMAQIHCFEEDLSSVLCPVKCEAMLECGDKCSGTCGECQRGRLHAKCLQKCGRTFVCGHICKFPCASVCPPCEEPCSNYCFHSKCPRKCYEPCAPCRELCKWRCRHLKCNKACGELCDRPPCNKTCKKLLKCGHPCIGLCGEPCPQKCRVCDHDEVCEILFGNEDDEDARFIELQDCGHVIEVGGLDYWMTNRQEAATDGSTEIQFKVCPKCKTSIRKSSRYGNVIKRVLIDMEIIKKKQLKTPDDLLAKFHATQKDVQKDAVLKDVRTISCLQNDLESIKQSLSQSAFNQHRTTAIEFQLLILPRLWKGFQLIGECPTSIRISHCTTQYLKDSMTLLRKFIMKEFLSTQQMLDAVFELRRLTCMARLLNIESKIRQRNVTLTLLENSILTTKVNDLYESGWNRSKVTEEEEAEINDFLRKLSTQYHHLKDLTEEERLEIVKAIGLEKGHWYKCPNGHYYCIGECGGAMEKADCPECGSTIGGAHHTLAPGNVHAGEMDNSRHAAWSDAANLENFDPHELARLQL